MSSLNSSSKNTNKPNKAIILAVFATIIIVALIGVIVFLVLEKNEEKVKPTLDGRGVLVTPDNVEEMREALATPHVVTGFTTDMTTEWTFNDTTVASQDAYIGNFASNDYTMYFEIFMSDPSLETKGDLLFSSPYIPVGAGMNDIKFDKKLEPGDYTVIVEYHQVDENDNYNEVGSVSVSADVHVLG